MHDCVRLIDTSRNAGLGVQKCGFGGVKEKITTLA